MVDVEVLPGHFVTEELYECGHHRPQKSDIYGETNAYRRRCYQCQRELERVERAAGGERG